MSDLNGWIATENEDTSFQVDALLKEMRCTPSIPVLACSHSSEPRTKETTVYILRVVLVSGGDSWTIRGCEGDKGFIPGTSLWPPRWISPWSDYSVYPSGLV